MQSAANQVLVAGARLVLNQSRFHNFFVLSLSIMAMWAEHGKMRGAPFHDREKHLYII